MVSAPWTLTRHEDELRIDLLDMEPLSQVENQAIVDALRMASPRCGSMALP